MKKALSLFLCLTLLFSCLGMVSFVALADGAADHETEIYEPVTIKLTSEVKYKNAYKDVSLDAVFTHEDGTTISLPGFWYEDQTFALRFAPTKEGKWTYKVTCSNAEDTALNGAAGTILAKPTTKTTDQAKHGYVQIKPGGRYFQYQDGTPFFWLGDTNWQAPSTNNTTKCNYPGCNCGGQFQHIVNDRVEKGFTVYQTYFSDTSSGSTQGNDSYWKSAGSKVNTDVWNERIDFEFQYLHDKGMMAAVGFGCHHGTPGTLSQEDMVRLARYIVARYACYNIVWITGQEITDTEVAYGTSQKNGKVLVMDVYMAIAEAVEQADGYKHPNSAHMYPMEASDERAQRLGNSDWHDFWTLQGGHGARVKDKKFYLSYYNNVFCAADKMVKPYIEGELNYEEINCGGYTGYDAPRRGAWNAMLCGTAGFTYGVNGIWLGCYSDTQNGCMGWDSSYSYEPWYMGVDKPGSLEVKYMKQFFENLPDWQALVPVFYTTDRADFADKETKLAAITEDNTTAVCYFYNDDTTTGYLKKMDDTLTYQMLWFDPLTGQYRFIANDVKAHAGQITLPEKPDNEDWVLLVTSKSVKNCPSEEALTPVTEVTLSGSKIDLTSVKTKAYGSYTANSRGEAKDLSPNLFDGDTSTVYEPYVQRTSQTFSFDLGKAMDLTNVRIVPQEGTIVPQFRVYGSNDENIWNLLLDTRKNGKQNIQDGAYLEALSGGYRFVKVLILSNVDIPEEEVASASYKIVYNAFTKSNYSHTALAELELYASGDSASPVQAQIKDFTMAGDDAPEEPPAKAGGFKLDIIIYAIVGVVVVAAVAVVIILLKPKKKKTDI